MLPRSRSKTSSQSPTRPLSRKGSPPNAWLRPLGVLIALALWTAAARAQAPVSRPETITEPAQLSELAAQGRFVQILQILRSHLLPETDPLVRSLLADLERHQHHQQERNTKRQEALSAALAQIDKAVQENNLDLAMRALIDAHGLSDDPAGFLSQPRCAALIDQARQAASQAQEAGDWLEALNLYRYLNILFEETGEYAPYVRLCERHVRLLRMYDPQELQRLLIEQAERLGRDKVEPPALGSETWQEQLEGIRPAMLTQALGRAARQHISSPGYQSLMLAALDALVTLAQTPQLSRPFPTLAQPERRQAFLDQIQQLRDHVRQQRYFDSFDTARTIERVLAINRASLDLPEPVLIYEMADGALSALDEFSSIIWPREVEDLRRTTQGRFFGVGILISRKNGRLIVVSPLEGTPAQRAGIKAGDTIVSVDGQSTAGWSLDQAVRRITGPEGTLVRLTIERAGHDQLLEFELRRAEITIESVRGWQHKPGGGWDYWIDPAARIGYVRLTQFLPQTAADLDTAVNAMDSTGGLNGLILDLRFNPGGLLSAAVDVTNRFLRQGAIVATVEANGRVREEYRARPDHTYRDFPLVILINEGSASASEIVAGALQDWGRATVVGWRSFGKGSVQDLFVLENERAYLKLTTQYYRLPKGRIIHRLPQARTWGIEPDLPVRMTAEQIVEVLEFREKADVLRDDTPDSQITPIPPANEILEKGLDPQLEAALLMLKTRLVAQQLTLARQAPHP